MKALLLCVSLLIAISQIQTVFATPTITHSAIISGGYSANGTFLQPRGMSFANGYLYVADSHAQTIQKFDGDGNYISEYSKTNPDEPGCLNDTMDAYADSSGKLFVTDIDNIAEVFDTSFNHIARIGYYGDWLKDGNFESWWSDACPYNFYCGYSGTTTGIYKRTDWKKSGSYSVGMSPRAGYVEITREITDQIRSGVPYTASIYAVSDYTDVNKLKLFLMFLDSNNNVLAAPVIDGATAGIVGNEMKKMSVTYTAPANTAKVKLWIRAEASSSGSVAWDNLWFGEANWSNNFNYPRAVATDTNGNIYVTDTYNHKISKFNSNRVYQTSIGSQGSGDGQYLNPHDIVIDNNNNKYIADCSNNRIQVLNSDDTFNMKFGSPGGANGQFNGPIAVAVDTVHSRIYVADSGNHRINAFDMSGNFQWGMGSGQKWNAGTNAPTPVSGTGSKYFNNPEGIAVDSGNDRLYVSDTYNDRIYIINLDDFTTSTFGGTRSAVDGKMVRCGGVALDSWGNIYGMDIFNSRVEVFNPSGTYLRSIGSQGTGMGNLNYSNDIYLDSNNKVYVSDSFNYRVSIFNNDGTVDSNNWKIGTGNSGDNNGDMRCPMYMDIDTMGRYIVGDWGSAYPLKIFNPDKTYYGNIFNNDSNTTLNCSSGMAVDRFGGKIFVAGLDTCKILIYNQDYTLFGSFGQGGKGNDPGFFFAPTDVYLDDRNFVYIADYRNNRIAVHDYNGDYITSFGSYGEGNDNFSYPDSITGKGSDIYVAEWCNNRIHKLKIEPSITIDNESFENWGNGLRATLWPLGFSNVTYGTGITKETSLVHSGAAAIKMTASPVNSYVESVQDLKVTAGATYTPKVWVRSDVSDKARVAMYIVYFDSSDNVISAPSTNGNTWNVNDTGWTQMQLPTTAPTGAVKARLYLRHFGGDGSRTIWDDVTIDGNWHFKTEGNQQGWSFVNSLSGNVAGGALNLTITGTDPYMNSPDNIGADASIIKKVKIRMKNSTTDTIAQLFWTTSSDPNWDGNKRADFTITANDNEYTEYTVDLSNNSRWSGTIKQIRLDPIRDGSSGTVYVNYIIITS